MNIGWWVKKASKILNPRSLVLMYHRVAEPTIDPWQLAVSSSNFEQQLRILKATGLVVPMSDVEEGLYCKEKLPPSIVITFDDGYLDNYLYAKPLLEKYSLPATFFVCTHHIGTSKRFWWDELAQCVLLSKNVPSSISLQINDAPFIFGLPEELRLTEALYRDHKVWNGYRTPSTLRSQLYMELWHLLSPLAYEEQQRLMHELKQWSGELEQPNKEKDSQSMSESQLLSLASGRLFNIGAHTVYHPLLSRLNKKMQSLEINRSKQFLEALTGKRINSFAYPSGDFNDTTVEVLRELDFKMGFTTEHKPVKRKEDPFSLGRFQVNNWAGAEFKEILSSWFDK